MSVRFKKVQNKILGSASYNKWFGRVVTLGNVGTNALAEELSHSTTVTRADIKAVLDELAVTLRSHLLNSQSVHLDGIGTFRVGIRSIATESEKDFNASKIKGFHIVYQPERTAIAKVMDKDGNNKSVFVKDLLYGAVAEEMPKSKAAGSETDEGSEKTDTGESTGDESQTNG